MKKSNCFLLVLISSFFLLSCEKKTGANFEVSSFNPVVNPEFSAKNNLIAIQADLSDAPLYGIVIPSQSQCQGGKFAFNFTVKYTGEKKERLFYKIYYQNESYKMNDDSRQSYENFYGSWEDVTIGFKVIDEFKDALTVKDSFTIVGNPRDEKLYYGGPPETLLNEKELLKAKMDYIRSDPDWNKKITDKAKQQKIDPEEQIYLDALWALDFDRNADKTSNNRWKRNPRMGEYKFMLVVVNEERLRGIPSTVKNLDLRGTDNFENPFSYFKTDNTKSIQGEKIVVANTRVKVKAKMDLGAGIYVSSHDINKSAYSKEFFNKNCGENTTMLQRAHFIQYFHYINKDFPLRNIPEALDVMDPSFTREEYEKLKALHDQDKKFIDTYVNSSSCPCKTVISDSTKKEITLINPGNTDSTRKKEHVGVMGRVGFSYGKWIAKIKFPALINKQHVWNGLTNAFWLLAQETDSDWNLRRVCDADNAYIPKSEPDVEESLSKGRRQLGYSEIDFEILKESQYWPATSYKYKKDYYKENAYLNDDITVTCTNWDMGCREPSGFDVGAVKHKIDGLEFVNHRWNSWHKSITTKVAAKNEEVFGGDYYYFEIDWQPTKIIWRIGPEKDKMRIVCIMDNTFSAIPNNQMVAIVTQEWHNQEWWPMAPYKQNYVPFPKRDIIGKILEIEVE